MNQSKLYSRGIELASFLTSSGLLRRTWDVISSSHETEGIVSSKGEGLSWKVYKEPYSDLTIIVFEAPQDSNLQPDLVPSSAPLDMNFHHFDFPSTKRNPIFQVDRTAFSLLCKNHQMLDAWKKSQINSSTRLIVTGHGVGGSVASLFTISLLESIQLGKNRPLCVTYGSPLIGDRRLQQAISRNRIWNSCFLHVVSVKDSLPRRFIIKCGSLEAALCQTNAYMPFGTFLFCSDVNSTCLDNLTSIWGLFRALGSIKYQNEGFLLADYGNIMKNLNHKSICKDLTSQTEDRPHLLLVANSSLPASSIRLQLQALGFAPHTQQKQPNIDINSLKRTMNTQERKLIWPQKKQQNIDINPLKRTMNTQKRMLIRQPQKQLNNNINSWIRPMNTPERMLIINKTISFSPFKKQYVHRINMYRLTVYKRDSNDRNIGYYDSYKNMKFSGDRHAVGSRKSLTQLWENIVERVNNDSQKGGAPLSKNLLYAATDYRTTVKPLVIAEFYRNGGKDYMTNRSQHFVLLEEWFRNYTAKAKTSNIENSSFWECVEKALHSRGQSMAVHEMEDNFNLLSDDENEEEISAMCPSFWARVVDQLLLSTKELSVDECDIEPCFEARVDGALHSRQGSVEQNERNIKAFRMHVDKALLSPQESMVVRDRTKKINMPIDSCFWAHVEEALLLCQELTVVHEKEETLKKLVQFEDYVYGLLHNYQVSAEIFLQESSYMRWWNEYKAIKGTAYDSKLASFMNDPRKPTLYAKEINSLCVKLFCPQIRDFC